MKTNAALLGMIVVLMAEVVALVTGSVVAIVGQFVWAGLAVVPIAAAGVIEGILTSLTGRGFTPLTDGETKMAQWALLWPLLGWARVMEGGANWTRLVSRIPSA